MSNQHRSPQSIGATATACVRCGTHLLPGDRFCPECGADALSDRTLTITRDERDTTARVNLIDVISLTLLTGCAFAVGSVFSVIWESRMGTSPPWPIDTPLMAGGAAAGAVLIIGSIYLLLLRRRHR